MRPQTLAFATSMASFSNKNLRNAAVALLAPLPSILFYLTFLRRHSAADSLSPLWTWCHHHPLLLANLLFFLNVDLLFWLVGLLQSSHWMIDLYWMVIPILLLHYFATHPFADQSNAWRSRLVVFLTWAWSLRLGHCYFRREKWQWGAREDWRFTDMRRRYGQNWWWISFFSIYLSQQVFLMAICMPFYVIHSNPKQLNIWDAAAAAACLTGVTIAYFGDTQMHNFVSRNERLKEEGKAAEGVLEQGLWRYCRHPNYFGEQLWWSGIAIFGWNLDYGWWFMGPLMNGLCLAIVTLLVEERMLKEEYRAEAYKNYQKTTSVWMPWFRTEKDKET